MASNRELTGDWHIFTITADEADYLAYNETELPPSLRTRVYTAVINAGRGNDVAVPLTEDDRKAVNAVFLAKASNL